MVKGIADDEDDNVLESMFAPFSKGAAEKGALATIISMGLGRYSNLFRLVSGAALGIAQETSGGENETVNKISDGLKEIMYVKPIVLQSEKRDPRNQFDYVIEQVAPGAGGAVSNLVETGGALARIPYDVFVKDEEAKKSDMLLAGRGGLYAFSYLSGGVPFAALGARVLKANIQTEQRDEKREEKVQNHYDEIVEQLKKSGGKMPSNSVIYREADRRESKIEYRNYLKKAGYQQSKIDELMEKWNKDNKPIIKLL
jgi:hypothetical protein